MWLVIHLSSAVSRTCTAPLDRLKIFFQVCLWVCLYLHALLTPPLAPPTQVSSMQKQRFTLVSCFQHMLREGGVTSLWRGNGINVIKIAPESALRFFAYEHVSALLKCGSPCYN